MKKILISLLSLALIASFAGCNNSSQRENYTKKEIEEYKELKEEVKELKEALGVEDEVEDEEEEVETVDYTGANYLTMTGPANDSTFREAPVVFTANVSPNTTKIVVTAVGGTVVAGSGDIEIPGTLKYNDVYTLTGFELGDESFTYRASVEWNTLAYGSNDHTFKAFHNDGSISTANLTTYYIQSGAEMGKPVIYLYPEEVTDVFVNVEPTDGISISDPEIGDGWHATAHPDGTVVVDGEEYPYLFWEGYSADFETPGEGFVVADEDVENFFDEKLALQGMNAKESADFKEFWLPILSGSPYYFITFIPENVFDTYAPLTVIPEPDSIIRVFFDYKELDGFMYVPEQELEVQVRSGFSVIEWGGRLYR